MTEIHRFRRDGHDAVSITQAFMTEDAAGRLLVRCQREMNWQQETFQMFGRTINAPRLNAWIGDRGVDYRYSGRSHPGLGWPSWLEEVRRDVQTETSRPFNHLTANRYRTGADHLGWHRDDERGVQGTVVILSLGAPRTFRYRRCEGERIESIVLLAGSLLQLDGQILHSIKREPDVEIERISLTFRYISSVKNQSSSDSEEPGGMQSELKRAR